jgi:hypothetical protein
VSASLVSRSFPREELAARPVLLLAIASPCSPLQVMRGRIRSQFFGWFSRRAVAKIHFLALRDVQPVFSIWILFPRSDFVSCLSSQFSVSARWSFFHRSSSAELPGSGVLLTSDFGVAKASVYLLWFFIHARVSLLSPSLFLLCAWTGRSALSARFSFPCQFLVVRFLNPRLCHSI